MTDPTVFIVDDDEAIRDSLRWMLKSRGVASQSWKSAKSFLASYGEAMHGCLVLDIRMDGMSGLDLFDRLNERRCQLPVIFLTGHADVPMAVAALKKGAHDFVEKPFNDNELVDKIDGALAKAVILRNRSAAAHSVSQRLATLSQREREVMDLILAGKANKVIADDLKIAMRTVEVHRAHVLEKMGVRSAVESGAAARRSDQGVAAVDRQVLARGVGGVVGQEIDRGAEQFPQRAIPAGGNFRQDLRLHVRRVVDALDALHRRGHVAGADCVDADAMARPLRRPAAGTTGRRRPSTRHRPRARHRRESWRSRT